MALFEFFAIITTTLILSSSIGFLISNLIKLRIFEDFLDNFIVNIGIGLAFIPLFSYLLSYLSIKINLLSLSIIILILIFLNILFKRSFRFRSKFNSQHYYIIFCIITYILLISKSIIFSFAPGSTDITFHSVYVKMIIEDGALPQNWELFESPIRYALGAHSTIAFVSMLSFQDPIRSSLIVPCFFAGYMILSVYLLSKFISKRLEELSKSIP